MEALNFRTLMRVLLTAMENKDLTKDEVEEVWAEVESSAKEG